MHGYQRRGGVEEELIRIWDGQIHTTIYKNHKMDK